MPRKRERGFTLVELMITVAILAILTGILVYSFLGQPRKVRSRSEVTAQFTELARAEAQYAVEHGVYYSTGVDATDIWPASPQQSAQDATSLPTEWTTLHATAIANSLYCGYVVVAGAAADAIPSFASDFGMTQPTGNWYAMYAECNQDGNSSVNGTFFASSVDSTIIRRNEEN